MKLNTWPERMPDDLDAQLRALERQIEEHDPDAAKALYDREYFPLACLRISLQAQAVFRRRLAFIPVGTQPYSPILATLANPAMRTVYLYTQGSKPSLDIVLESVQPTEFVARDIGDVEDPTGLLPIVEAELALCGRPNPLHVAMDVTSGRKATVAVLGSIAAALGFQQTYILSQPFERHPALHRAGRLVHLPCVRAYWGLPERATAIALLQAGAFHAAEKAFETLAGASAGSSNDRALQACCQAFRGWLAQEATVVAGRLERAAQLAEPELAKRIRKAAERAERDHALGWPAATRDAETLARGGAAAAKAGPLACARELAREVVS
ncbi:MAG: hypothetical protein N2109_13115 [Fimbriimonadales bacterium]|nr:hypothetical protein [Fimbriimonadales bacterium]